MKANASAVLGLVLLLIVAGIVLYFGNGRQGTVSDTPAFQFETVTTPAAQAQGLGGRSVIPHDYGMLFVFNKPDRYGFWMKDMLVPIDIIWLSDSGAVLGIIGSLSPQTYPRVFYPPEPVRYVLETRAGEARAQGWSIGSVIVLPLQK
jgi:uncharacterized membrane protein (UPF0127 family)